jgi:chaperonin GroES
MVIVPIGDNLVIKRTEAEDVTAGGIVLPDSAKETPTKGRVLSVGDGQALADGTRSAPQVAEGEIVLFSSHAGTEIHLDGETLLILGERDVLAVLG